MKWLELKIPPPLVAFIFAALIYGISRAIPGLEFGLPGQPWISIVIAILGGVTAAAGVITFRISRTTVNPKAPERASAVVNHGIYRISRNPMYLGLLLILTAWALFLANVASIVLLAGFVAYMTRFQIKVEERVLRSKFGDDFESYMSQVRRWI
jgi:protein-S-isoprenylcysteine O-methyltransferase Ste14